jgi:hypothetical protein
VGPARRPSLVELFGKGNHLLRDALFPLEALGFRSARQLVSEAAAKPIFVNSYRVPPGEFLFGVLSAHF